MPRIAPDFCAERDPGFGPANTDTKTDNFKVKKTRYISPEITVKKFHDKNANGVFDFGDEWVTGWLVDVTDPTFVVNPTDNPATIVAEPPGDWFFDEKIPVARYRPPVMWTACRPLPSRPNRSRW